MPLPAQYQLYTRLLAWRRARRQEQSRASSVACEIFGVEVQAQEQKDSLKALQTLWISQGAGKPEHAGSQAERPLSQHAEALSTLLRCAESFTTVNSLQNIPQEHV
mmetsp:Transcript_8902/g.14490  ORF Transcript_8902/g.14490 Transcript_8902/m.14490 type:complete len:106 (-) Transcript_8902:7-324(-)